MPRSIFSSILLPVSASLALIFSGTGCDQPTDVEQANIDRVFLYGNSAEPQGIDPHMVSGVPESKILSALFEGLIADSPTSDTEMLPGAATHWETNDDATEWTFHLRKDGKWSDGKPVTARDFAFAYERILTPEFAAKYADMLYFIENAEAYNKSQLGQILCLGDPDFPADHTLLEEIGFQADESIKDAEEGTKQDFLARGLDSLTVDELETIRSAPRDQFTFPDALTSDQIDAVLERLIDHHKAGKPDLWEEANVGVDVIDDHTLRIRCRESVPFLPSITRHYTWFPVPEHTVLEHGAGETRKDRLAYRGNRWATAELSVGNGPFKIKEWKFNSHLEVERNPHYWDRENVWLNGVKFIPVANPYTEIRAFRSGQLHTTYQCPAELVPGIKQQMPEKLRQEPYVGALFVRINTTHETLKDQRVRKALNLAIDRQALTDNLLYGHRPAESFTPPIGDYHPPALTKFDVERANQLLDDAGFEDRSTFPQVKMLVASRESARTLAEALQAMWSKNLGITITVENKEWSSYITATHKMDFDIVVGGWIGDYLDPTTFLYLWQKGGGNNNTGWSNDQYEDLLKQASHEGDAEKRLALLAEAETVMMNEAPIIPISWYARNYLIHPSVKGWSPLLLDNHPYKAIRLKQDTTAPAK